MTFTVSKNKSAFRPGLSLYFSISTPPFSLTLWLIGKLTIDGHRRPRQQGGEVPSDIRRSNFHSFLSLCVRPGGFGTIFLHSLCEIKLSPEQLKASTRRLSLPSPPAAHPSVICSSVCKEEFRDIGVQCPSVAYSGRELFLSRCRILF